MSTLRNLLAAVLAIVSLALATPAAAGGEPGKCTGSFVNPITDICWSCLFPISIGRLESPPPMRIMLD